MCIENFLLLGFKILANSLKYTCEGFHFYSNTAGWKHEINKTELHHMYLKRILLEFSVTSEGLSEFGGTPIK